ncbi:MAG: hypothetical protein LBT26_04145 [Clostridiales Family XIII bacterium]|jgi:hypothetical protein|nr:hypothetical protein [Clostridiales Family XIII bacterium]
MTRSIKNRSLSVALVLALIVAMFAGLTVSANAAGTPGAYTVTFAGSNVTVQVGGATVASAATGADGTLAFATTPDANYGVAAFTVTPATSNAVISVNSANNFTISNVESNVTLTITTTTGNWTDSGNYSTAWYSKSASSFTLNTASDLAGLAAIVNGTATGIDQDDFTGKTVVLANGVDLAAHFWVPIGGAAPEVSNIPTGSYFAGTFSGAADAKTAVSVVSNMYVTTPAAGIDATNMSGWGLFGAAKGNVANVDVNGSIVLNRGLGYTGEVHYAGGVVGYSAANVYNCQTNVNISVENGANLGTVVGGLEYSKAQSTAAAPIVIEYCLGTGDVVGAYEVAGLVGGVYCQNDGEARAGYSAYLGGTIATTNTNARSYSGGLAGVLKGWVGYTYATNVTLYTPGGHYLAGLIGHAEGRSPIASIFNSYANVINYSGVPIPDGDYTRPFVSTVDNSNILPINDCTWTAISPYTQPNTSGWGAWSGTSQLESPSYLNDETTVDIIGDDVFEVGPNGYPIFIWQSGPRSGVYVDPDAPVVDPIPGGTPVYPADNDDHSQIFVDGTASVNGDGSYANPYNNIADALKDLTAARNIIYIKGTVTLSSGTANITSTLGTAQIKRSSQFTGFLFKVTGAGAIANVYDIVVDGNKTTFTTAPYSIASGSLFAVGDSGTLNINAGAVLQNNYAGQAGAITVDANGTLNMNGGELVTNQAVSSAGAVMVHQRGTFNLYGGEISGNTAGGNGNGIYLVISGGLVISPSGAVTFGANDTIYLPNTDGTVGGQVSFIIGADLDSNVPLAFQTPLQNAIVATTPSSTVADASYEYLISGSIEFDYDNNNNIYILNLTK